MKLLRWTLAGASAYVIYKYSIGKKAKGEDVFVSPERTLAEGEEIPERASPEVTKRPKARSTKRPAK